MKSFSEWAIHMIQAIAIKKDAERRSMYGMDSYFLTYIGLGSSPFISPRGNKLMSNGPSVSNRERAALSCLEGNKTRIELLDEEEAQEELVEDLTSELAGLRMIGSLRFQDAETEISELLGVLKYRRTNCE